eukprot:TRINITY_DN5397_c0_g1_i1.p1 TRINITY_DN5397_c0_g1~~TRINITY_DN5397_c0_g1_i1.p1  ORF type:complete len:198 (-),score=45.70 TRINITY_DN5397_c0_g1_i1:28-621(-)
MKVVVFYGSVRPGRLNDRVGTFVVNQLKARGHQINLLDPKVLQLPLLEKPQFYYPPGEAPAELNEAAKIIEDADAYVVVSAEYNHSIPPALSNLMSHFGGTQYKYRPAAIVTYSAGQWGGMRAAMQLRSFLAELGCLTISPLLGFPIAQNLLTEDGKINGTPEEVQGWEANAARCIEQLEWVGQAVKEKRRKESTRE